jgi:protein phosphatase
MAVSWAAATHTGLRRPSNEDSYATRPDLGLFIVADGMGGHVGGEVASRVAVEAIEQFIADTVNVGQNDTWPFPIESELTLAGNRLKSGFRLANRRIAATMAHAQQLRGMATTASAILVADGTAVVAHVGDSRVYRLRRGQLEPITRDHSWVEEQVRAGTMSASMARQHPWRNVVTRALSGGEDPEVDVIEFPVEDGDRILLCSDGLYGVVADDRIGGLLGAPGDLPSVAQTLIEAANDAGGPDNITVLVLQLDIS